MCGFYSLSLTSGAFSEGNNQSLIASSKLLNARRLLIEGTDCLHNNQNQQAKVKLQEACSIAPDLPQAHHQLGIALAKLGENQAAINEFSTATKLDPNLAASWLNLAAVYQSSGNSESAISTYQEFINRFPQDRDISKIKSLVAELRKSELEASKISVTDNGTASISEVKNNSAQSQNSQNENSQSGSVVALTGKANVGASTQAGSQTASPKEELENKPGIDYYADISGRGIWLWLPERMPLRVYIEKSKPANGASPKYITIMKKSFTDWSSASKGLIKFNFVDSPGRADITCTWSKDVSKFKNSTEAANARVFAKNGSLDKGEIEILTVLPDTLNPISDDKARITCLHEIGHVIGLTGHSNNPDDVMYISAPLKESWAKLSSRDVNTILRLYSAGQ